MAWIHSRITQTINWLLKIYLQYFHFQITMSKFAFKTLYCHIPSQIVTCVPVHAHMRQRHFKKSLIRTFISKRTLHLKER